MLAFLGAFCLCFSACTRYDAALLPLPTLSGAVVVLYISALPGMLHVGLFLVLAILLATGVYCGVRAGARAVRDAMGSAGFWLFLGGAAFLWVLFGILQPMFTQWDEFTAWGLAPKMVAERAALYVADPVNLTASFTYPATSLLSYLFQRTPGQFSEWQCMAAIDILALAALAPATVLPRARWGQGILVFAVGAVLPFFFSTAPAGTASTVYQNAMADLPLAALFGGSLCLYYAGGGRRTCFYATALPLAMLAMTKDIGLAYGLIAVFVIGIDQLFGTAWPAEGVTPRHVGGRFLRTAVLAVPVLAVFLSWSRYTAAMAPDSGAATVGSGQMGYGAVLSGGIRQLLGIGREERFAQIMQAMGQAFFTRKVCLVGAPVMVVALVLVLTLAAAVSAPKGHARRRVGGGLPGFGFLLCGAVCVPSDSVLLQFLGRRRQRPQGLRALPYPVSAGMGAGHLLPAGAGEQRHSRPCLAAPCGGRNAGPGHGRGAGDLCLAGCAHRRVLDPGGQRVHHPGGREIPCRRDERGAGLGGTGCW